MSHKPLPPPPSPFATAKLRIPKPVITKNQEKNVFSIQNIPYPEKEHHEISDKQKDFMRTVLKKHNCYPEISVEEITKYWALPLRKAFRTRVPPPEVDKLKDLANYIGLKEPMTVYEGIALIITYYYGEEGKGFLLSFNRALNWAKVLVDLSGEKPVNENNDNAKFRFSFFISLIKKIEEIISTNKKKE